MQQALDRKTELVILQFLSPAHNNSVIDIEECLDHAGVHHNPSLLELWIKHLLDHRYISRVQGYIRLTQEGATRRFALQFQPH